jgi:gliding motility-associated-like protein
METPNPAELAIVTLAAIPSGQTIQITDRGWHPTAGFDVTNVAAEGLITWTTTSLIPAGTVIKVSITPGVTPTVAGLSAYGTASATGWGTLVTAGGGDNWFIYTGNISAPGFIYAFANWSTNNPGGSSSPTPWQTSGNVNATTSYLPALLAAGNFSAAFTGSTLHGDYIIYTGTIQGTKDQILADLAGTTNWTHSESTPVVLTPGGTGFPGTNPIFQLPPTVTQVTSSIADGTYKTGDIIPVNVTFSTVVSVTGTPTLSLNTGAVVNYSGGTGTNTLTFNYTVVAGQSAADLDYSSTTALSFNGGTIQDASSNSATLTLAAPGTATSLGANKNIVIDAVTPTLTSVAIASNNPSNQRARTGEIVTLSFTASEALSLPVVTIAGNSALTTSAGGNNFTAVYTLTGAETEGVIPFNIAFTDLAGNVGTPVTVTTNSSSVTYDKTVPTLTAVTIASNNTATNKAKTADVVTLNFTASESIAIPTVTIGGAASVPTNAGGNNWTATHTVSGTTPEGILTFNIAFVDLTGNAGTPVIATTNSSSVTVDRTPPAIPTGLAATSGNTQNVITWTTNTDPDLDKYFIYGGTTALPTTLLQSIPAGTLTYTHTGLTNGTPYFYSISAVDLTGNESTKSSDATATPQGPQTITFAPLASSTYGASAITLTATSSSALPVTYTSSNTAVATISGSTVTILAQGTTTITALQAGDAAFLAATPVTQDLVVNKQNIAVTAVANTKVYGTADPAFTYTFSPALIGTDVFTGDLDRATGENTGNYAIGQGTVALSNNYTITFTSADLSITAKPVTVTAAAKTKIFTDADPAFTYTYSPALTGTDAFTGNLDRAPGENVGPYTIGQGNLSLGTNYQITYVPANLDITAKSIAVTAVAKTKVYGEADPAFTYTFSPALNGTDTFTGSLDRVAGENIGNHAITQGTLALSPNYAVVYNGADLSITTKTIAVTSTPVSKVYGTADPVLAYTFSPALIGTDTFTGNVIRAGGENVGNYGIGQGSLALSSNYTIDFFVSTLSITEKTVNVTAAAKTKEYGTADPALTYTFSPALTGTDTFTGNLDRATGENAGNYAIGQGTLALSSNYTLAFTSADLSITAKPVTVTAVAQTKVFTTADPAFTYTYSPALIGTDTFTGNLDRAPGENVGPYAITQSNLSLGTNYQITYVPANLTITSKAITVTAVAKTKVYGDADPALTYTFSPALNGTDTFTGNLDRAIGENIGNYAIGQGSLSLSPNYAITYNGADLNITQKAIAVTATAGNKEYGTADPVFAYTFSPALIGTDIFTGTLDRVAGENIGNYAIGQGTLALNSNYILNYATADFSITKKTVNVTATVKTKEYGTADPALTYTFSPALIGTDTFTGDLDRAAGENIGNYAIGQGTLALNSNYTLAFTSADLNITAKPVTVTAVAKTKIFTAADPAFTYTYSPALIGTDTFTGNLNRNPGEDIGTYAITQGNLSLGTNYQITYVPANLSITSKSITVTAVAKSKVYGEADPALTYTFSPALNGTDTFTGNLDRTTGENIGNYAIIQGSLSLSPNYAITYNGADLNITQKAIAVTATAGNKEYGTADPVFAYTFSPALIGTDTFTGTLDRVAGENIGNYAIGQGTLALNSNYILNYATADFSITKKTVNVTATVKTKEYGTADPALTYTFSPALIGTDTFTGDLDRAAGENIGNYAIGQGTLALNSNYTLAFTSADLNITAKPVTVTAVAKTKIFTAADPAFTYTYSPALIGTDTFTGNLNRNPGEDIGTYAITQGNLSLGTNYQITYVPANLTITSKSITVTAIAKTKVYGEADPTLTYTFSPALDGTDAFTGNLDRAAGENIGNYAIGQGNLSLGTNYALIYNGADLSITQKTIAITATAGNKEYGTADPVFAYTFSPALIGTDTFTGNLDRAAGENIGNYAIGQGTLALNSNYILNYATADFSITKKTVNVTATVKTKIYGEADPALTYTFSPTLIGTDVFTGSLNRTAGENIGNYAIGQGTLALNSNYTLAFTSADLNITSKPLTITAVAKTKVYGTVDPALTYTFSPALIGTDAFTGSLTRTAGENIGSYAIAQGTVTAGSNYLITYNPANLSITSKALTVTAVAQTKTYGDADPVLTYTFSPALTGTDTFTGSLERATGENIGSYAIAQGTVTAGPNYLITYTPANLSIGTKTITATATPAAKTYGTADPALTYTFSPALIGTDAFTGNLNRIPGENTGTYAINQNTLALSSNYVLNYTAANLSINQAPLTITAEDKVKFAGTANPTFTVKYDGFVNAETPAVLSSPVVISTTATTNSPIGTYDIVPSAATANNYQISFVNGTLTIRAGAPTNVLLAGTTVYENSPSGTPAGTISSTADDPAATFTYALVSGTGDTDNALFSISGNNLLTAASLNFENKSSYSIRLKSTTQYGFSLEKAFNISISDVNEIPTLDPVASQTICYTTSAQNVALTGITAGPESAQTTTVTATSSNNNLFQNITATNTGNSGNISYRVKSGASGTATITVTVKDDGGTDNGGVDTYSRTFVITVNPLPVIAITADNGNNNGATGTEISKGESLKLTATGGVSYVWATHSSIISGQNTATLTVRPRETTTYTVTATNGSGCTDSKTFTVTVVEDYAKVKATNILSPNGDGYNDKWVIDNIDFYPNNEVKIFDKAGRPIYSKKGYDNSWDGNLNGTALSEGTYYYVIDFGTSRPKFKGFITVIRQN